MNALERRVRAHVIQTLRETASAPGVAAIAAALDVPRARVVAALRSLAEQHRVVLLPGSDSVWMARSRGRWQTVYDLGLDWYTTRLDPDFEPAASQDAQETFARHGLVGDFWSLT